MLNTSFVDKLINLLEEREIDAVMIAPSDDLEFLMGFSPHMDERFQALFILRNAKYFYIVPKLNREEIEGILGKDAPVFSWDDGEGFLGKVKEAFMEFNLLNKKIAVNGTARAVNILRMKDYIDVEFLDGKELLEEITIIKNTEEMENLRRASQIADEVFEDIIKFIRPGITEGDIRNKIEELFIEKGADSMSFEPIIASGPNSSKPHYNEYSRVIQEKDIILLDFGCKYKGMCSDISRTVFVGDISKEERKIYEIVYRSNRAGEDHVKEGVRADEVDQVARDIIKEEGYGEYFLNRLGHGIGYSVHEAPDIKGSNSRILEKGMAFSIEPGIYLPGRFGVRIEDIVLIGEEGTEILNKANKDIVIIK